MLYKTNDYYIQTINMTKVDETFVKISYSYQKQFPFYWDFFVNEIISNKKVTYFKDSTAIFNLEDIRFRDLEILFTILKMYLNNKVVLKIIHKKEFIIAHFNECFHMEYIRTTTILMSFGLYRVIDSMKIGRVYLGGILTMPNEKRIINIILEKDNNIYLFDGNDSVDYQLDKNIIVTYIYTVLKANNLNGLEKHRMRLTYYEKDYPSIIKKIIFTL